MARIKKGDPVEFFREHPGFHVTVGDGEIGIATEAEHADHSVTVELADGTTFLARHIVAYAWAGWLPEELEETQSRLRGYDWRADMNDDGF